MQAVEIVVGGFPAPILIAMTWMRFGAGKVMSTTTTLRFRGTHCCVSDRASRSFTSVDQSLVGLQSRANMTRTNVDQLAGAPRFAILHTVVRSTPACFARSQMSGFRSFTTAEMILPRKRSSVGELAVVRSSIMHAVLRQRGGEPGFLAVLSAGTTPPFVLARLCCRLLAISRRGFMVLVAGLQVLL